MALTIYGEARGEPQKGKVAVAWTIRNRYEARSWYGDSIKGVCLKPWQFSVWNEKDPNRGLLERMKSNAKDKDTQKHLNSPAWFACLDAAIKVLYGSVEDLTRGSTHYHTTSISPKWSVGHKPVAEIGHHVFYNTVK